MLNFVQYASTASLMNSPPLSVSNPSQGEWHCRSKTIECLDDQGPIANGERDAFGPPRRDVGEGQLSLAASLPDPVGSASACPDSLIFTVTSRCAGGLAGRPEAIAGIAPTATYGPNGLTISTESPS